MATYALLPQASANRVYGAAALGLAAAELRVLDQHAMGAVIEEVGTVVLGGVEYLRLECGSASLRGPALDVVSNLSGLHALFEIDGDRLRPIEIDPIRRQDDDVVTIQRYAGKTNEALTHLLVNLALAAVPDGFARLRSGTPLRLLDPACGRGTTVNRAIVYGLDAVGVDHDRRDLEAYESFLLGWLKDKRLKHEVRRATLRKGRPVPARRCTVTYGAGKDRSAHRVVDLVHDDTVGLRGHLGERSVDLIACDLPYGVQHGATAAAGGLRRSPGDLLEAALPVWREVLRPGGGMSLAWNLRTLPRPRMTSLLREAGFDLLVPEASTDFEHRVDRSIQRDVVLAARAVR